MITVGETKRRAKQLLNGNWRNAALLNVIPVLIALLLAGGVTETLDIIGMGASNQELVNEGVNLGLSYFVDFKEILVNLITILFTTAVSFTLLDLVRNPAYRIDPLNDSLRILKNGHAIQILAIYVITWVFTFLWSLLLIIPGIIAAYAYSQAYYIYKDSEANGENLSPTDCISQSKELMRGHKGRLFLLELSFIGWHILALFTFGLAYLFLTPYIETSKAVFYQDLLENS